MPRYAESNACSACARSKRKCGRQMPSCARCAEKGMSCVYPPSKSKAASSSRLLLSDTMEGSVPTTGDGLLAGVAGNTSSSTADLILGDDLMPDLAFPLTESDFTAPLSLTQMPKTPAAKLDWFLAPETWRISHKVDTSVCSPISKGRMKQYVAVVQSWFERWATTGSNPFIHPCLYSANSPACVQIAYTTLASYIHRTPATTDIVLQIVEDRSNDLLRENGAILDRADTDEWADGERQEVDLFAQLTRLHALMVYQIIGLFDGDIRSRHVAEGHLGVLDSWTGKLFHSAAKTLSTTHTVATHLVGGLPTASTDLQQQWYLWVLSESIRRTWLVAISLAPVFTALQQGWSACPGSIMFTNRSGFWSAASAIEWEKQCSGRHVAFLQRFECSGLFDDADSADIDEFGHTIMDITYNEELLEQWRDRSSNKSRF